MHSNTKGANLPAQAGYGMAIGLAVFLVTSVILADPPSGRYHGFYGPYHVYYSRDPSFHGRYGFYSHYKDFHRYEPYAYWPHNRAYGSRAYPYGTYSIHPPPQPKAEKPLGVVIGPAKNPAVPSETDSIQATSTADSQARRRPSASAGPNSEAARNEGWGYLAQGDYQGAVEAFATLAYQSPRSGLPKIGYGLSNALSGNHHSAAYAIRRAFRYDPEAANYPPIGPALTEKLRSLQQHYQDESDQAAPDPEAHFMLAAISHFLHDEQIAYAAIQKAEAAGDHSLSLHNLKGMIENHLHGTRLFQADDTGD